MPRSEDELTEALAQSEAWMDAVNPDEVPDDAIDDRKDLRQIGVALISIEAAEQALLSAVADARANKRSWTDIANILGVSRQAARQRFEGRVTESDRDTQARLWTAQLLSRTTEMAYCTAIFGLSGSYHRLSARMGELQDKVGTPLYDELSTELVELVKAEDEHGKTR